MSEAQNIFAEDPWRLAEVLGVWAAAAATYYAARTALRIARQNSEPKIVVSAHAGYRDPSGDLMTFSHTDYGPLQEMSAEKLLEHLDLAVFYVTNEGMRGATVTEISLWHKGLRGRRLMLWFDPKLHDQCPPLQIESGDRKIFTVASKSVFDEVKSAIDNYNERSFLYRSVFRFDIFVVVDFVGGRRAKQRLSDALMDLSKRYGSQISA